MGLTVEEGAVLEYLFQMFFRLLKRFAQKEKVAERGSNWFFACPWQ